jgi:acetylornithine deacetylase
VEKRVADTLIENLYKEAVSLLQKLIETPSFSKEEDRTATIIDNYLKENGVNTNRHLNNIWAKNLYFDPARPTVLLNSHHDTVKPNTAYIRHPFSPDIEDGKLFGLGSNDAGGCLVSLIMTFLYFYEKKDLKYNFVLACTAEEENSGKNGIEAILNEIGDISFAIVGEPTLLDLAISEKGLLVIDCTVRGKAGHAAREEGDNAIYKALKDIEWFRSYEFPKVSPYLGKVKMSVTIIQAGSLHNMVPDKCEFTVDVRVTDEYTHEEILDEIEKNVSCEVVPRSCRLRSSKIDPEHPIVKAGIKLGSKTYGSPTTSDQALIPAPSLKLGPGDSARSHSADEFIFLQEIKEGIEMYINILEEVVGK